MTDEKKISFSIKDGKIKIDDESAIREKEAKKAEREQKKAEREKKKAERIAERERKKAEREQKRRIARNRINIECGQPALHSYGFYPSSSSLSFFLKSFIIIVSGSSSLNSTHLGTA